LNERTDHCTGGGIQQQDGKDRQKHPEVEHFGTSGLYLHYGGDPEIRRITTASTQGGLSMSILFGIVFLLGGLGLAVFLGIVLYRDPKRDLRPHENRIESVKRPEAA
jgi:hypothetical protein